MFVCTAVFRCAHVDCMTCTLERWSVARLGVSLSARPRTRPSSTRRQPRRNRRRRTTIMLSELRGVFVTASANVHACDTDVDSSSYKKEGVAVDHRWL